MSTLFTSHRIIISSFSSNIITLKSLNNIILLSNFKLVYQFASEKRVDKTLVSWKRSNRNLQVKSDVSDNELIKMLCTIVRSLIWNCSIKNKSQQKSEFIQNKIKPEKNKKKKQLATICRLTQVLYSLPKKKITVGACPRMVNYYLQNQYMNLRSLFHLMPMDFKLDGLTWNQI